MDRSDAPHASPTITRVNLTYPVSPRGSRKARTGQWATRHLQHCAWVLHDEHGRACKGCQGGWRV